jgi:predicted nucleic acid-binding protein
MIYLDTAFCIYLVEDPAARGRRARELVNSDEEFAVSPLVMMECLVKPLQDSAATLEDDYRATFAEFRMLDISATAYERAARLRASTGVKTPDAIHWATATLHGCSEIWTGDALFAAKSAGYAVNQFAAA